MCKCCNKSIVLMTSGFLIFIVFLYGQSRNIISLDIAKIFCSHWFNNLECWRFDYCL